MIYHKLDHKIYKGFDFINFMKLLVITQIFILSLLLVISGCESPAKKEEVGQPIIDPDQQELPPEEPIPTMPIELNLKVGETAKTSLLEVSVFSVIKDDHYTWISDATGDEMDEFSDNDKMFYFADVEIKNVGSERAFLSATTFSIADSDGYKYDPVVLYYGDDGLDLFKELYQNQKMKGKVVFEVPKDAKGLKLVYDFGNILTDVKLASWAII